MKEIKLKEEKVKQSIAKLKKFFHLPSFPIKIYLTSSRKEFERLIGRKTAPWEVGHANGKKSQIYLLSPLVFEKESIHKKEDFPKVLLHELTHLFTHRIYPSPEPRWLCEGLAYYLASQGKPDFRKRVKLKLKDNFLTQIDTKKVWEKNLQKGVYQLSFHWINFLIKKFGRKRILELLKKISLPYEYRKFTQVFEQIYHEDLDSLQIKFLKNYFFQNPKRKGVR